MNHLNSILIEGTLAADPELTYDVEGKASCAFTVKCSRTTKGEGAATIVTLFPVVCARRTAEVCGEYLKKGRGVRVVGSIQRRMVSVHPATDPRGHDEPTGEIFIVAEHVEFKPQAFKTPKDAEAEARSNATIDEPDPQDGAL